MAFDALIIFAAIIAAAVASIAGFGVGSILTPLLAIRVGTKLAVAAVSVPHLIATALRFALIREHVDKRVFLSFGITSAAGGLAGALLHRRFSSIVLSYILGALLVFAGLMGITRWSKRLRFEGAAAWIAGALSGIFGGLVGNQGGIRSAAMLGMRVSKESFVATATAVALVVDAARMPVYALMQGKQVLEIWPSCSWRFLGWSRARLQESACCAEFPSRPSAASCPLLFSLWESVYFYILATDEHT